MRHLLLTPNASLAYSAGQPVPTALSLCSLIYVEALEIFPTHESTSSTIYSLLNSVTASDDRTNGDGSIRQSLLSLPMMRSPSRGSSLDHTTHHASESDRSQVLSAIVYTVGCLAAFHHKDKEVVSVSSTLLLQRLGSRDQTGTAFLLDTLAVLTPYTTLEQFLAIVKATIEVAESVRVGEENDQHIVGVSFPLLLAVNAFLTAKTRSKRRPCLRKQRLRTS